MVLCVHLRDMKTPFSTWNTEQVCDWLEDIGLGPYSVLARQWVTSGQTLLSATPHDLEKVHTHTKPSVLCSISDPFLKVGTEFRRNNNSLKGHLSVFDRRWR